MNKQKTEKLITEKRGEENSDRTRKEQPDIKTQFNECACVPRCLGVTVM